MDTLETYLKIKQNDLIYGQTTPEDAANMINNEKYLNSPLNNCLADLSQNTNGSINTNKMRDVIGTGHFEGASATLQDSRLYSINKNFMNELFEQEKLYKRLDFEESGFFNQFANDYGYAKRQNEISSLTYKLEQAKEDNDFFEIARINKNIKTLKDELNAYQQPLDNVTNTFSSLAASATRNPVTFAITATAATIGYVFGVPLQSAIAAQAINAAILYHDTGKVEAGSVLQEMENDENFKKLSPTQKLEAVEKVYYINGGLEAAGQIFGLKGVISKTIGKTTTEILKAPIEQLAKRQFKEAQKELLNMSLKKPLKERFKDPNFIKYIGYEISKDIAKEGTTEGLTEVMQDDVSSAYIKALKNSDNYDNLDSEALNNILSSWENKDELNDKIKKFLMVAVSAGIFSGIIQGTGYTARESLSKVISRSEYKSRGDEVAEKIIEEKAKNSVFQKSPKAYGEMVKHFVEQGSAPTTAFINTAPLQRIIDEATRTGNTELLNQLENLGITQKRLEQDSKTEGITAVDFSDFENVVLDPNKQELFQKVKGEFTFDETTFTKKERELALQAVMSVDEEVGTEIEKSLSDPESIFNKTYNALIKNGQSENVSFYQALTAQQQAIVTSTFTGEKADYKKFNLDIVNVKESFFDKAKKIKDKLFQKTKDKIYIEESQLYEKEKIDSINNEYKGETININGQEKTVYNSDGKRIAKSEQELRNFYNWFGDSKVIDEQGRPLVVYHGTSVEFNEFKKDHAKDGQYKKGFFFTSDKQVAMMYGDITMPVYLKAETDYRDAKKTGKEIDYMHPKNDTRNIYIVFNPNQIKSIENRGTFRTESDNILKSYIGVNARTALLEKHKEAVELYNSDKDMKYILKKTGWFKDPKDGKWKYEISDKDAKINFDNLERLFKGESLTVKDILTHDKLFAAYPEIADMEVKYNSRRRFVAAYHRQQFVLSGAIKDFIEIGPAIRKNKKEALSALMHEIQHKIQYVEKFQEGGNTKNFKEHYLNDEQWEYYSESNDLAETFLEKVKEKGYKLSFEDTSHLHIEDIRHVLDNIAKTDKKLAKDLKRYDVLISRLKPDLEQTRFYKYINIPGENEARDVSARIDLTDEERKNKLPANLEGRRSPIITITIDGKKTDIPISEDGRRIAGTYSKEKGQNLIRLTEAANPTTFLHEFNHMTITEMLNVFNSGKMTDYWKKNFLKFADFVEAKPDKNGKFDFTEQQFEKIAEAFTTYLKTGKAPIKEMQTIFDKMREWFIAVYKKLKMQKVNLDKSITEAFDSLLITEEQLNRIKIDKMLNAIGRRSNVSEDDYQRYLSDLSALNRVSTSKHIEAIKKKARIALEEKNIKKKQEIRDEVIAELSNLPEYQLLDKVYSDKILSNDIPAEFKIENKNILNSISSKEGVPIQQYITDFSDIVSTPLDVLFLIINTQPKVEAVEQITTERFESWLKETYKDLADTDIKMAAVNDNIIKVRIKEYLMLRKIPLSQFEEYYKMLKIAAEEEVDKMSLQKISNTEKLLELEERIIAKARFAKTDNELANALWHHAASTYLVMRSKAIAKKLKEFNRHFDKYRYKPKDYDLKKIDAYDYDLVTDILNKFKFTGKKSRERSVPTSVKIGDWISLKSADSFNDANIIQPHIEFLSNGTKKSFSQINFGDFTKLDFLCRIIESVSQSDKELVEEDKRVLRETDAQETIDFMEKNKISKDFAGDYYTQQFVSMESLLSKVLPSKIFNKYVLPFIDSFNKRNEMLKNLVKSYNDALKNLFDAEKNKKFFVVNENLTMSYQEMQVAVFNIDNMECWLNSWNAKHKEKQIGEKEFLEIIQVAPEQMLDDARSVWNIFESLKEDFRIANYKVGGFLMDFVEPRVIELPDGRKIQSGYYPSTKISETKEFKDIMDANNYYPAKVSGNARDKLYVAHNELDLTINSLHSVLYREATFIAVAEHYNQLLKLFNNTSLYYYIGEETRDYIQEYMKYPIVGDHVNQVLSTVDTLTSMSILGWDEFRAIVQSLGFIPAMSKVNPVYILKNLMKIKNIKAAVKLENAMKLSPYMQNRFEDDLKAIFGSVEDNTKLVKTGKVKNALDNIQRFASFFTVRGDAFASSIVWNASYEEYMDKGYSRQEAILHADHIVRTTQGSLEPTSRPDFFKGDKRVLTKFASYFISIHSNIVSSIKGRARMELIATLMLAGIMEPILTALFQTAYKSIIPWEKDKRRKWNKKGKTDFESRFIQEMKDSVLSSCGAIAIPAMGLGSSSANIIKEGVSFENNPILSYASNISKTLFLPVHMVIDPNDREKDIKNWKKSALKSLTIPNKYANIIVE